MAMLPRRAGAVLVAAGLFGLSACSNTTNTVPTAVQSTETFSGTLQNGISDKKIHQFTVNYSYTYTNASVTVNSLKSHASGADLGVTISVGFGSIAFDGSCTIASSTNATAANVGQQYTTDYLFQAGNYCIQIYDSGTLTEPADYKMTVLHY